VEKEREKNSAPQIIIKKKRRHPGVHGGSWKVAYADFVTAMMALFIVLWVLGQDQSVVQAVTSYFKDPAGKRIGIAGTVSGAPGDKGQKAPAGTEDWKEREKEKLKEMGGQILMQLSRNPEFKGLTDQIKIEIVNEGLRIELVESANDIFFEIGTSTLKTSAQALIREIGSQLARLPNKLVVEGHTDSRAYSGGVLGYTNFELSAERANMARRALIEGGVADAVVDEVRGYADRRLRDSKNPLSFTNRRISIIVRYPEDR
jgi:chemotaxis protein MotB